MSEIKTEQDLFEHGNLKEYDYKSGEMQGVIDACPEGKVIYTECDGDDGCQFIEVGLRLVNRYAIYFGDDLGLKEGQKFRLEIDKDEPKPVSRQPINAGFLDR